MVIVEHDAPIPFNSPFTGILHPITEAPDEAFAQKMTGDGFFVYPEDNTVYAPCDSDVTFVFDTHHAMGLTASDGTEYLLHIGIDTVRLQGEGFTVFVEAGQHVQKGDRLLSFDEKLIREKATSDACICLFPELPENWEVRLCAGPHIVAGEKRSASVLRHRQLRSLIFFMRPVREHSILLRKPRTRSIPINRREMAFSSIRLNQFCTHLVTGLFFLFLKKRMPLACTRQTDWNICCRPASERIH